MATAEEETAQLMGSTGTEEGQTQGEGAPDIYAGMPAEAAEEGRRWGRGAEGGLVPWPGGVRETCSGCYSVR